MNKAIGSLMVGVLAIALTLGSGVLHGRIRHAGGLAADLTDEIEALNKLPKTFGRWELVKPVEFDERVVEVLECSGYHQAEYRNTLDDTRVFATVLLGPSGPIAVHTPEVCMPSQNSKQVGKTETWETPQAIGKSKPELKMATFKSSGLNQHLTRIAYAWTMDGNWETPQNPRSEYAGKPYLYKVQVATSKPTGYDFEKQTDPLTDFLPAFLEALNETLFEGQR